MRNFGIAIVVALAVAGCATTPTPISKATEVPASRIFAVPSTGATGTATFVRDTGFQASGCLFALTIDGTRAALIDKGERATLRVPPGARIAEARYAGNGLCRNDKTGAASRAVQISVTAGETSHYRIAVDDGGIISISPVVE